MGVWPVILTILICYVPVITVFAMMPYIGRRTLTFGVSIPSGRHSHDALRSLRKSFAVSIVVSGLAACAATALMFAFLGTNLAAGLTTGLLFVYIIAVFAMYVRKNKQTKQIKQDQGWQQTARETNVADTRFSSAKRSVSALWFLLYAVVIIGTLLAGILLYDQIPGRVPMQTDFEGNVTRMADKTYALVLFAPALQAFITLLFGFIYWMMLRTPPVIDPEQPEASSRQNAVFRYRWSAFVVFGGVLLLLVFSCMQLGFAQVLPRDAALYIPLVGAGLLVVAAIVLSITTGQSGSRVRVGKAVDGSVINRDDDKYWKWGSIYVNKDDPALFVEKRFGVGFTLNFGRKGAVAIGIGFLVFIIAVIVVSAVLAG